METFTPSVVTTFGTAHTAISILSLLAGVWALFDGGRITLGRTSGKAFYITTLLGTVSGLMIFHHGGFGLGHGLSLLMLLSLAVAYSAGRGGKWRWEIIAVNIVFFLDCFFATTEFLTRWPAEHPFAANPADTSLAPVRLVLVVILIIGSWLQLRRMSRMQ